ncbi:RNA-guided endonuclease InsQ/TnpB family protein [Paraburkholderia franconis]|nr:RNA-guided endonuclease TnpB family protein [Paraburkholderia franconis]
MSSTLTSGVRFRLYPAGEVASVLRQWIGCQRFIYSSKVDEDHLFAAQRRLEIASGKTDVATPLDQQYAHFKNRELTPWLYEVPSQILRNGAVRWMTAKQRQLKGLGRAPRRRTRRDFNSVLITGELFRFVRGASGQMLIEPGTDSNPIGQVPFIAHRIYDLPKQIVIREEVGRWYVSFCYERKSDIILREPEELAYELNRLENADLSAATLGIDRNVRDNCIATSDGRQYRLDAVVLKRIKRKEIGAKRHQRRMARSQKGSSNRRKLAARLARKKAYAARARSDFAHKTTCTLATSPTRFFVLEDLQIPNLVKRPKAKFDEFAGKWLRNGAGAKAGLNRSILQSCWGAIHRTLAYKAARRNKLVGTVPAAHTSQECSRCGHIHPDNREGARFVCRRCGLEAHADHNAACNIKARGIERLRDGQYESAKTRKRVAFRRKSNTTGGRPAHACEGKGPRPEHRAERIQDRIAA